MTSTTAEAPPARGKSPVLAAILSFFIPGLGQIYAGYLLRGVIVAIPQMVVIGILGWIFFRHGAAFLGGTLTVYAFAVAVVNILMLVYRAFAVVDAYRLARNGSEARAAAGSHRVRTGVGAVILGLLLVATASIHGVAAYESYVAYEFTSKVFNDCSVDAELPTRGCETADATPPPLPTPEPVSTPGAVATPAVPTEPGATPGPGQPSAAPSVTPSAPPVFVSDAYWAENGRLDLLLLGADAGPGRIGLRPDAVHVASVDLATGRAAITSLPRYLQYPPLPPDLAHLWPCGCFRGYETGYLNAIYTWATDHPQDFPGGANRGFRATQRVVETMLGISIDGIVVVDLNGFVDAVDAIGGILINVPEPVVDDRYGSELGIREFVNIRAGWQHMDGHTALMYVRSRHQDSDIARLGRQQNFLRALRRQLTTCAVEILPGLDRLLRAVGDSVRTDVPLEEVPALLELLTKTQKPRRLEMHSDNGFVRDWTAPGQKELYLQSMASVFQPRPGEDNEEPEETPPPRFGNGC